MLRAEEVQSVDEHDVRAPVRARRVERSQITHERLDPSFYDPDAAAALTRLTHLIGVETRRLGDLADVILGAPVARRRSTPGTRFTVVGARAITNEGFALEHGERFDSLALAVPPPLQGAPETRRIERAVVRSGDILVPARATRDFRTVVVGDDVTNVVVNSSVIIIRGHNNGFLARLFGDRDTRELLMVQLRAISVTSAGARTLTPYALRLLAIPIPGSQEPAEAAPESLVLKSAAELDELANRVDQEKRTQEERWVDLRATIERAETTGPSSRTDEAPAAHEARAPLPTEGAGRLASTAMREADLPEIVRELLREDRAKLDDILRQVQSVLDIATRTQSDVHDVKSMVTDILALVRAASDDIAEIKAMQRDVDEKVLLMTERADLLSDEVRSRAGDRLAVYRRLVERNVESWHSLEELSREFLVVGEYLFSRLQSEPDIDFSSAILQFCRSLELEIGVKTFQSFTSDFARQHAADTLAILEAERRHRDQNVQRLAKQMYSLLERGADGWSLTLGQMRVLLRMAVDDGTANSSSVVMRALREYVSSERHPAAKLTEALLGALKLDAIVDEFRNKCAHPHKIVLVDAERCRKLVPRSIDRYLGAAAPPSAGGDEES